jgi:hypothetical protein
MMLFPLAGPRVFYSPDDAGGGGGGEGGGGDAGEKEYTKAQVEQIVQGRLTKLQRELAQAKAKTDEDSAKLRDLESQINELRQKLPNPPDPPQELQGQLKLLETKHQKLMDDLKKQLDSEKTEREKEHTRRMNVERDNAIFTALREAGCRDDAMEVGKAAFLNSIEYLTDEDRWVFNLKKGGQVTIKEGIQDELPDYLRESSMRGGGSGSTQGAKTAAAVKRLDAEKDKLSKLHERSIRSGADSDIQQYQRQKRLVTTLEKELASA